MTDATLERLSSRFALLYAQTGRPSVPPEHLLRALLLQVLYSIRSERLLIEQLEYNLLFRWFVGLGMDDAVWTPTMFTKNRERLLAGDVAGSSLTTSSSKRAGGGSCPTSTSRWTARCSRPGPGRKAFGGRASRPNRRTIRAIRRELPRGAPVELTHHSTTDPDVGCSRRRRARKRSWGIWAKC